MKGNNIYSTARIKFKNLLIKLALQYFKVNTNSFIYEGSFKVIKFEGLKRNEYNVNHLIYKDETWEKVINRWSDREKIFWGTNIASKDNNCKNTKVHFMQNGMTIKSEGIPDDWIYIIDEREFPTFELSFNAEFFTKFREIQFAFRHINFYNRYRFRIENKNIHFDIVYRGVFFNSIHQRAFELELNTSYHFKILITKNSYNFYSNNVLLLGVRELFPLLKSGTMGFILWDLASSSNISAEYNQIQLNII